MKEKYIKLNSALMETEVLPVKKRILMEERLMSIPTIIYGEDEKSMASLVTRRLNSFAFNYEKFCEAILNEHKTLQQSFTRLCIAWIRRCASLEPHQIDPRNEDSVRICRIIAETMDKKEIGGIPMV